MIFSKASRGFTLVEVITVTVIIAVLATITTVVSSRQQIEARDMSRSVKATLVANSLESYYDEHGEYPSPRGLTNGFAENTGTAVATKLSITDKNILVMPNATAGVTNSLSAALNTNDEMAYVARASVGDDNCQTNAVGGCDEFTLTYKKELDASIVTIESTYKGRPGSYDSPLKATDKPTIAVVQSGTNLVVTSSTFTCPTEGGLSPSYTFRERIGAGSWLAWSAWQAGNVYTRTGNANATLYSFQVQVRCASAANIGDISPTSDPVSVTYYIMPAVPAVPTVNATQSGTNAVGTASIVTCNYGNDEYRIDYRTNGGAWTTGSWAATNVRTLAATNAVNYGFLPTARCVNGTQTATSAAGVEDSILYYAMPTTPAAPVMNATTSGTNVTGTSSTTTCNYGTAQYLIDYRANSGTWVAGSWGASAALTIAGSNGASSTTYGFRATTRCVNNTQTATSALGVEDTVLYYGVPNAPATPTINAALSGTYAQGSSGTVACNYGSAQYRLEWRTNDGTWQVGAWGTGLIANITAADGSKYGFRTTARCVNGAQITQGATSAEDTYVHPIDPPGAPGVSGSDYVSKTFSWSAVACPAGTWATYQYNFLVYNGAWAWQSGTWTYAGTGTSAANGSATGWGVAYNIGVMQRCTSNYTSSAWSAATWGTHYYNPVGYSQLRGWSMRIMADNSVTLALANYGAECDAYTTREIFIETSWDNAAFVLMGGLGWYGYNTPAPHGLAIAHTTTSGHSAEFWPRTRCINPATGYASSASGLTSISRLYNTGNLYNKGSSKYNISCGWGSANNSLCSGGYNSSGTNATGTSYDACAIRAGGIEDTANRYTPYISLSATPPCWLVTA